MNSPDDIAARYLAVQDSLRQLESEKDELRVLLMDIAASGASSDAYEIRVSESRSDRIESLKAIRDKSPSLFDALHSTGCIREVISTRVVVKPLTKT